MTKGGNNAGGKNLIKAHPSLDNMPAEKSYEKRPLTYLDNGATYEGEWLKGTDIREGQGKEVLKDGTIYIGDFKESYKTGKGKLTLASGYVYEGDILNDAYHGQGKMKYPDGRLYEGGYMQGQCHG